MVRIPRPTMLRLTCSPLLCALASEVPVLSVFVPCRRIALFCRYLPKQSRVEPCYELTYPDYRMGYTVGVSNHQIQREARRKSDHMQLKQ